MTILMQSGMVFVIFGEMFPGRISLNLMNFVSGSRLELWCIFLFVYHVKPHSFPWFSVAFAAVIGSVHLTLSPHIFFV